MKIRKINSLLGLNIIIVILNIVVFSPGLIGINIDFIDKVRTNSYDKSTEVKIFNLGEGYNLPLVLYNTKYKEYVINNITLNEKQAENKASKLIYNYIINTYP